ncbi:MAG: hypothetical protein ACRENG_38300 [bacterium]
MNKETQVKIQLLTENDLTEAMRLIEPANWNHFHTGFGIQSLALLKRGFVKQRDLIRMRYGKESSAGASTMVFAIAGPEIG